MTKDTNWQPCKNPAIADIIRWREPIWSPEKKKRGKPDKVGEQMLTAEVLSINDVVELLVTEVTEISRIEGQTAQPLSVQAGARIKRKKSTIDSGNCQSIQ